MRILNCSSVSPVVGRNCHWLRKRAVSFTYCEMSSSDNPLTTRLPRNGGTKTGLSVTTSGDRDGNTSRRAIGQHATRGDPAEFGIVGVRPLHVHEPVHRVQPLERVAPVEDAA